MDSNQYFFYTVFARLSSIRRFPKMRGNRRNTKQKTFTFSQMRIKSERVSFCINLLSPLLLLVLAPMLSAQSSGSPDYRAMEAHQHGQAELRILLETNRVEIEFESPAFNLVGFEHKASSSIEKKAVKNAKAFLESPAELISFGGTACSPEAIQVDVSSVSNEEDKHQHDDEHDHEAEHQHDDEHDEPSHEHETETSHADIIARYSFSCGNKRDLSYFVINFFRVFPGLEKIKALWVSETRQGSMQLTQSNRRLDLN